MHFSVVAKSDGREIGGTGWYNSKYCNWTILWEAEFYEFGRQGLTSKFNKFKILDAI